MEQQFRNIIYLSDRSGTGKWRKIWHTQSLDCITQNTNCQVDYSQTPITQPEYYRGMNSITVQRWIAPQQCELFCKFFKPLMNQNCGYLMYEIDDLMFDGSSFVTEEDRKRTIEKYGNRVSELGITKFNRGRRAFEGLDIQRNIKTMLQTADFITVTTDFLKEVFHTIYDVPLENIIAIPNLLPRYLFGDKYDPERKLKQFGMFKSKPRIGIVSSLSHYNIDQVRQDKDGKVCRKEKRPDNTEFWLREDNTEIAFGDTFELKDDLDDLVDMIRQTVDDFQWIFFGFCPPKLQDLADKRKIEVHGGVPIQNYPSKLHNLNLQAIVAPIQPTLFNQCKSFIKFMEAAAFGIPCFATNTLPYSRVMPEDQLFSDAEDLKSKLTKLKFGSAGAYEKIITRQWKWLNSEHEEGDFQIRNYWMEDNLNIYIDLYRMRSKSMPVSLAVFSQNYEARKQQAEKNVVFKNDEILITK